MAVLLATGPPARMLSRRRPASVTAARVKRRRSCTPAAPAGPSGPAPLPSGARVVAGPARPAFHRSAHKAFFCGSDYQKSAPQGPITRSRRRRVRLRRRPSSRPPGRAPAGGWVRQIRAGPGGGRGRVKVGCGGRGEGLWARDVAGRSRAGASWRRSRPARRLGARRRGGSLGGGTGQEAAHVLRRWNPARAGIGGGVQHSALWPIAVSVRTESSGPSRRRPAFRIAR